MAIEKQHTLTKKERAVMRVVYQESEKKSGVCLLTPIDIFSKISYDLEIEEQDLDIALRDLEIDDYFDLTRSDKKGELVYCINMRQKGLAFARVERAFKSNLKLKLLLAFACGIMSGAAALVIKSIFKYLF
ncbi:MAG: hypothetical protein RR405_01680 [Clostridia bacterium]